MQVKSVNQALIRMNPGLCFTIHQPNTIHQLPRAQTEFQETLNIK